MERESCVIIGPPKLEPEQIEQVVLNLNREVESLIAQGISRFICIGESGFSLIAASIIIAKREMGEDIQLIFSLLYESFVAENEPERSDLLSDLLSEADEVSCFARSESEYIVGMHGRHLAKSATHYISALPPYLQQTSSFLKIAGNVHATIIQV